MRRTVTGPLILVFALTNNDPATTASSLDTKGCPVESRTQGASNAA